MALNVEILTSSFVEEAHVQHRTVDIITFPMTYCNHPELTSSNVAPGWLLMVVHRAQLCKMSQKEVMLGETMSRRRSTAIAYANLK